MDQSAYNKQNQSQNRTDPRLMNQKNTQPQDSTKAIIFYDGPCGLCNKFVAFIVKHDHEKIFHFAPLQGTTAQQLLNPPPNTNDPKLSIKFYHQGKTHQASTAALLILKKLSQTKTPYALLWKSLASTRFIPRFIRDFVYFIIAKYRYKFFGKIDEACSLVGRPNNEQMLP